MLHPLKKILALLCFASSITYAEGPGYLFPPLASLALPGFDQYWERDYTRGVIYSSVALTGLGLSLSESDDLRFKHLGTQLYLTAGFLSSYESFRSATSRRDDFVFLKHNESSLDLYGSLIDFKYLSRPTTYIGIPALLGVSVFLSYLTNGQPPSLHMPQLSDVAFSGAFSAQAGVGEEALFRGYLMPLAMRWTGNEWVSNGLASLAFGAAHMGNGTLPIFQTLSSFYLGYVSQRDEWRLGETVFIHAWYDFSCFLLSAAMRQETSFVVSPVTVRF